jgi:hypothetical protein
MTPPGRQHLARTTASRPVPHGYVSETTTSTSLVVGPQRCRARRIGPHVPRPRHGGDERVAARARMPGVERRPSVPVPPAVRGHLHDLAHRVRHTAPRHGHPTGPARPSKAHGSRCSPVPLPAGGPAAHDPTGGPKMVTLSVVLAYLLAAWAHAIVTARRFGTNDRVAIVWLSALWPLSLLVLAVLLPLERTRFAPSGWRQPERDEAVHTAHGSQGVPEPSLTVTVSHDPEPEAEEAAAPASHRPRTPDEPSLGPARWAPGRHEPSGQPRRSWTTLRRS